VFCDLERARNKLLNNGVIKMKYSVVVGILVVAASSSANLALAGDLIVFPANGQSEEQLEQDKFACYGWAKNQTGFDPMAIPKATTPPPSNEKKSGGALRGAIGGAALGAIIGDRSKAARQGAAAGALVGGVRQSSANTATEKANAQWEQEQAANYANNRNHYNRAYGACLEGKGYSVK
jgi:hypothetical protein